MNLGAAILGWQTSNRATGAHCVADPIRWQTRQSVADEVPLVEVAFKGAVLVAEELVGQVARNFAHVALACSAPCKSAC